MNIKKKLKYGLVFSQFKKFFKIKVKPRKLNV